MVGSPICLYFPIILHFLFPSSCVVHYFPVGDIWTIVQRTRMRICLDWRRTLFQNWTWLCWDVEPWRQLQRDACKINKTLHPDTQIGFSRRVCHVIIPRGTDRAISTPSPIWCTVHGHHPFKTVIRKHCKHDLWTVVLPKQGGTIVSNLCLTDSRVFGALYKLMGASQKMQGCIALFIHVPHSSHQLQRGVSICHDWDWLSKNEHALHSEESFMRGMWRCH